MPELSRFFGIVIRMFFNDHQPPHFHALYGRALALVLEWATLHREELRRDWTLARRGQPPEPIAPLD